MKIKRGVRLYTRKKRVLYNFHVSSVNDKSRPQDSLRCRGRSAICQFIIYANYSTQVGHRGWGRVWFRASASHVDNHHHVDAARVPSDKGEHAYYRSYFFSRSSPNDHYRLYKLVKRRQDDGLMWTYEELRIYINMYVFQMLQVNGINVYAASTIGYILYTFGQVFLFCIFGNRLIEEVRIWSFYKTRTKTFSLSYLTLTLSLLTWVKTWIFNLTGNIAKCRNLIARFVKFVRS